MHVHVIMHKIIIFLCTFGLICTSFVHIIGCMHKLCDFMCKIMDY